MSDATADWLAVVARLDAYGWSLDDRDWPALAACFTADCEADYGETLGVHRGADAVAALCRRVLEPLDASQHLITGHQITFTGGAATTRCRVVAQHVRRAAPGGPTYTIGGTYRAALVRADGTWRIRRFALEMVWQEGNLRVVEDA